MCVHNAGRSQMAAAFMEKIGGDHVVVRSAGTAPAESINSMVIEAMAEVGIDLYASGARPKSLDEAAVRKSDIVITMGCGDECPYFPGVQYRDWPLEDPAGKGLETIRRIRDDIERRVRELLEEVR